MTENNEKQDPWRYWWVLVLIVIAVAAAMGFQMLQNGITGGP